MVSPNFLAGVRCSGYESDNVRLRKYDDGDMWWSENILLGKEVVSFPADLYVILTNLDQLSIW